MKLGKPSEWTINFRLLLVAILPLLFVAIALTTYHMRARVLAEQERLEQFGASVVNSLATEVELHLLSGDREELQKTAREAVEKPNIVAVQFYDELKQQLVAYPKAAVVNDYERLVDGQTGELSESLHYFVSAVTLSTIDYADHSEEFSNRSESNFSPQLIGFVRVDVDQSDALIAQRAQVLRDLLVAAIGLLFGIALTQWMTRSLSIPIGNLSKVVKRISEGDLSARVPTTTGGELGQLQQGLNHMAVMLDTSQSSLKEKITEATQQLQITFDELENRNSDLEYANQLIETASEAKDQFLARMSHELRTPITSITGFMTLLHDTDLTEEQTEYVDIVAQASKLLLGTVNDILDLSELDQSDIHLQNNIFSLEAALDNMVAMHESSAFVKGIELIVDIEQAAPQQIETDQLRLMQICNNLVANAIKFTDTGYVLVSVSVLQSTSRDCVLEILVRDSGIGISKAHLSKLFTPFYQGDTSIKRRYGGTGLGLMIAKKLTERMGGTLHIHSELGSGTEVRLTMPAKVLADNNIQVTPPFSRSIVIYDENAWSRRSIRSRVLRLTSDVYVADDMEKLDSLLSQRSQRDSCLILSLSAEKSQADSVHDLLSKLQKRFSGDVLLLLSSPQLNAEFLRQYNEHFSSIALLRKPLRTDKFHAALEPLLNPGASQRGTELETLKSDYHVLADKKVLVAEDNEYNRLLIQKLLSKFGVNSFAVADGAVALEALNEGEFDLALVDLHMPELDGVELAKEARALGCSVPIVLLTADVVFDHGDLEDGTITEVLSKPIDEKQFERMLLEQLGENLAQSNSNKEIASVKLINIDKERLNKELLDLIRLTEECIDPFQSAGAINFTHQMKGIIGLSSEDNELRSACIAANEAASSANANELERWLAHMRHCIVRQHDED